MKKFIYSAIIVIVTSIASWNFFQSQEEVGLSDLATANIEALARAEIGDAAYYVKIHDMHSWTCYAGGSSYCPLYINYQRGYANLYVDISPLVLILPNYI